MVFFRHKKIKLRFPEQSSTLSLEAFASRFENLSGFSGTYIWYTAHVAMAEQKEPEIRTKLPLDLETRGD